MTDFHLLLLLCQEYVRNCPTTKNLKGKTETFCEDGSQKVEHITKGYRNLSMQSAEDKTVPSMNRVSEY
jgi:hypothetical protein